METKHDSIYFSSTVYTVFHGATFYFSGMVTSLKKVSVSVLLLEIL